MLASKPSDRKRGAYSRRKGIEFEHRIARKFRAAGFDCKRVLEYDGFHTGSDLALFVAGNYLPIAIQCKNTKDIHDLDRGLAEAVSGYPYAKMHICILNHNRQLHIKVSGISDELRTWDELITHISHVFSLCEWIRVS